jgi:DNA polymerase-3 subunit chi
MPKVDFYLHEKPDFNAVMLTVCKLCEKAYGQQKTVLIYVRDQKDAETLDKLLWTYNDVSFLPHAILPQKACISIGFHDQKSEEVEKHDILLNLTLKVPDFFKHFERIIEVVSGEPTERQAARERYRLYRDNQCELNSHQLQK